MRCAITAGFSSKWPRQGWYPIFGHAEIDTHLQLTDSSADNAEGVVDLHWDLLNRAEVRHAFAVPTSQVITRSVVVEIDGVPVRTLDPVDTVLHLALHGCLSGGHRLGWLVDIDRAVRSLDPRWELLVDRAGQWKARSATGLMLVRAQRLYGTPVPSCVSHPADREALSGHCPAARSTRAAGRAVQRRGLSAVVDAYTARPWTRAAVAAPAPRLRRNLDIGRVLRRRAFSRESPGCSAFANGNGRRRLSRLPAGR